MKSGSIIARAPATVANLICGYDTLSLAIGGLYDEVELTPNEDGNWRIQHIENGGSIPYDVRQNTCTVVMEAARQRLGERGGFDVRIKKGYRAGSGLGSSAASAVAALWAYNASMEFPFSRREVIELAMLGEKFVSGSAIADNVAAATLGGLVLVRSADTFDFVSLPIPDVKVGCLFPQVEIITREARSILPEQVLLTSAVRQGANLAGFIVSLYQGDLDLLQRSMHDHLIEHHRSPMIPHYETIKEMALDHGALCFGISGSGPSVFYFCRGAQEVDEIATTIMTYWADQNINSNKYIGEINPVGVEII